MAGFRFHPKYLVIMLPWLLWSSCGIGWPFARPGRMMGMSPNTAANEMCPMMGRMPVKGIAHGDLPEPKSNAAKLYSRYCSQCHALPSPKAHSAQEWVESFRKMDARMQMMGRMCRMMNMEAPNETEKEIILAYLQKHALKAIAKEALPAPESKGTSLFKNTCSQCHDLPDPQSHTPEEWPRIVGKMADIIRELKPATQLSDPDKERITRYLQEYSKLAAIQPSR